MNVNFLTIYYCSIFFWLLPPIRQYRRKYFYYFLILALSDPFNLLYVKLIGFPLFITYSTAGFLLLFSITYPATKNNIKKTIFIQLPLMLILILGTIYFHSLLYLVLISHFLILLIFIRSLILPIYLRDQINFFYVALVFYELSIVVNIAMVLGESEIKVLMFYITISFQFLLAIFFTIFTEKSPSLNIQLRTDS